jgi:hypothetical protein
MYRFVGPSEVISSKQKKTEIKLDINLLSQTNKYKTKQKRAAYTSCIFHCTVHHLDDVLSL